MQSGLLRERVATPDRMHTKVTDCALLNTSDEIWQIITHAIFLLQTDFAFHKHFFMCKTKQILFCMFNVQ